ncbi:hypothetical protein VCRA2120O333_10273 [Vibrio crassostreae]|nr:hypothetical protein VCRA2121O334_10489 [Vibrio crassostreae]CAK3321292.1 hypothetical protein VCRA2122O341_10272 [Vibrio crassostreae]CAK3787535.1 hypothetical protein VCRA2120O333_10273 [Vibrio crassostreae]
MRKTLKVTTVDKSDQVKLGAFRHKVISAFVDISWISHDSTCQFQYYDVI